MSPKERYKHILSSKKFAGNPQKGYYLFAGFVLLLHLLFFGYQMFHQRYYLLDSKEYVQAADNLREHQTLFSGDLEAKPLRMDHYSKRPFVYPALLATAQALFGHEKWLILLQVLLSLFNIYWVFAFSKLFAWRKTPYWLFAILILLYPAQLIYANLLMTEILFQTEIMLMVYGLILAHRQRSLPLLSLIGLLLILSMITKPIMYLFCVPLLLLYGIWAWQWRKAGLLLVAIIPILFVWGYQEWNESRTGYFHFSSIQNLSLLQYTTYNLLQYTYGSELALHKADSILYASLDIADYGESQRYLQSACFEVVGQHPGQYLVFHIKGMLNFFLDPGRFDLYHFFGWETVGGEGLQIAFSRGGYQGVLEYLGQQPLGRLGFLLFIALANACKGLALLVFPFVKRLSWWDKILVLLLIFYVAGLTGVSGASRFAVPLFPLMLVVVGCVWQELPQLRNKRQ